MIGRNACISGESPINDRHLGIFSDATFKAAGPIASESEGNPLQGILE